MRFCGRDGRLQREFLVARAHVGLFGDAVQNPLAHIAFKMQQQVGDGVLVITAAVPELFFRKLRDAGGDLLALEFKPGDGEGEEVFGYGLHASDSMPAWVLWRDAGVARGRNGCEWSARTRARAEDRAGVDQRQAADLQIAGERDRRGAERREDPNIASVPVILLSARAGEEAQVDGLDMGADDYLIKPFSARELIARVSAALKVARLRETSEAAIREERTRLLEVLHQAPAFFALLQGPDHIISLVNPLYLQLINNRDVIGQPVRIALPDAAEQGYIEILDKVFEGEPYVGIGSRYDVFAGEGVPPDQRYVDFIYQPLREANGIVSGIIVLGVDVTDRKMAQDALLQSEKLAAVGLMASSIAHEINNPLEAVTNLLYLARSAAVSPAAQEFLETADDELKRVAAVVTKTLRFHRQSSKPSPVSIDSLIDSALSLYQTRIVQAEIAVARRSRISPLINCLDGEIRQVLSNLVGNAVDAMTTQGGRILVRSRSATHWTTGKRGVLVTVADTGPGISQQHLSKIFEPFFSTKGEQGTGLGLWISKEIIERHRGVLRFRSRAGSRNTGSVFTLFLPCER